MTCITTSSSSDGGSIAKFVVFVCGLWLLLFPIFGGGAWGKDAFSSWAKNSFFHDKAGMPILMLTFPVLIAGSMASLFVPSDVVVVIANRFRYSSQRNRPQLTKCCSDATISRVPKRKLPEAQTMLLWSILFLPCLVYVLASVRRKLTFDMSIDKALSKSGNIFGMVAVMSFSWMLIPVSHRGPIAKLFQWDSIKAIEFHMWSGRIIVVASILHGIEHTVRYALQGQDVLRAFYLPPTGCWKHPQTYVPEICDKADGDEACSCYDHFLPLTGILAMVGLILIGVTSAYRVRRDHFATFAMLHYILTPLTFLAICIHYNKAILYASGSLLYYLASNVPTWIENLLQQTSCGGPQSNAKVIAVERMHSEDDDSNENTPQQQQPSQSQRPCIALTMEATEAAMQQFYPGAYLHLSVPGISKVSHPFSANRVVGRTNQIRVIFRVRGPFTRALEKALFVRSEAMEQLIIAGHNEENDSKDLDNHHHLSAECHSSSSSSSSSSLSTATPRLYLRGYYGSSRLPRKILSNDVCVVVAAGIGITPYLSMLSEMISTGYTATRGGEAAPPDGLIRQEQHPKQIILHWICRDRSLIEYCRKEYLEFGSHDSLSTNAAEKRCSVKLIIHKTGGTKSPPEESTRTTSSQFPRNDTVDTSQYGGAPFELSKFAIDKTIYGSLRYFFTFSAFSWGGLCCLWWWFQKQGKTEYIHRIYTLVAITLYGLIFGLLANLLWYLYSNRTEKNRWYANALNGGSNGCFDRYNDIELSTYKDQTQISHAKSTNDVPVECRSCHSTVSLEISEGRPLIETILEDLDVEKCSALFCCVPEHLTENLKEGIAQKSELDRRYNTISIYEESFVK